MDFPRGASSFLELLHLEDIVPLGVFWRLVLHLLPRIPLGLALEVQHARADGVVLPPAVAVCVARVGSRWNPFALLLVSAGIEPPWRSSTTLLPLPLL